MTSTTRKLIETVLEADPDVDNATRRQVLAILDQTHNPADEIAEREAARILGISAMTLCRWRNGRAPRGAEKALPFSVFVSPSGTYRYLRPEIMAWKERNTRRPYATAETR